MDKQFYVYILASYTQRLYIGVTSDLEGRIWQHKNKMLEGHSAKYNIDRLVYLEMFERADDAIAREKQQKKEPSKEGRSHLARESSLERFRGGAV